MRFLRLTLAGKFLLAICPFLITSSIGTAIYYVALHKGEIAFEEAISQETTLDDAARETASAAVRVGMGALGYLHEPTPDQRHRAERARADYWKTKTRYDELLHRNVPSQPERERLSQAFERFAVLSQSLIDQQDKAEPARLRVNEAEMLWRKSLDALSRAGGVPPRQLTIETQRQLTELDEAQAAYRDVLSTRDRDLEEFLHLRDRLDDLLDESHQIATDRTSSKRMAVIAAQKGITFVGITAIMQCTVGVAAILLLGRIVRRRIEQLTAAMVEISDGNLSARVPERGSDELADLTRGFNRMADQLERTTVSREELEDQEEALRLSEQRQRLLIERLKDCAIFTVGASGSITSWNAGAARLYGYNEGEVIAAPLQKLFGDIPEPVAEQLDLALRTGGLALEDNQRRKDGQPFLAEISITPLNDPKRAGEFVVLVRDVTAQRAAGLERQRHLDQLAHVGRLSVMGEMAAGFAHELNQPLGAISNYAEGCLLRMVDGALAPDVLQQVLERISAEAQRAGDIIHRVRAFARKEETHSEEVDLIAAIQHVAALLEHDALHQGVDLHLDLASSLPSVSGDRVQIEQVLVNLLRNGFDAVRGESSDKQVRLRADCNEEGDVHIAVADNGCGIDEGSEAKSFDAFYTTKADGLGMGLAISRTIIEAHGGRIWLSRNPQRGVTAHVTIPARMARAQGAVD